MKRSKLIILAFLIFTFAFAGCAAPRENVDEKEQAMMAERERLEQEEAKKHEEHMEEIKDAVDEVRIDVVEVGLLRNNPALGAVYLGSEEESHNLYRMNIYDSTQELVGALMKNDIQMAFMPAVHAASYHVDHDGMFRIVSANTTGALCVLSNQNSVASLDQIKQSQIFANGGGVLPQPAVYNMLLNAGVIAPAEASYGGGNTFNFIGDENAFISAFVSGTGSIAAVPEPIASRVLADYPGITRLGEVSVNSVGGVAVMRSDFIEQYPNAVRQYIADGSKNVEKTHADYDLAAENFNAIGVFDVPLTQDAIAYGGIIFLSGEEMKAKLTEYFTNTANMRTLPEFLYYTE